MEDVAVAWPMGGMDRHRCGARLSQVEDAGRMLGVADGQLQGEPCHTASLSHTSVHRIRSGITGMIVDHPGCLHGRLAAHWCGTSPRGSPLNRRTLPDVAPSCPYRG